ncbi:meiosis-specific transcription factor ndt80 [Mucor velutinosus]|uniref:Meiosis-specific transcription factor ndt80 n=1 Tax=Mucor velutinosus TaxID=708070 RepID=A0AAN7DHZ3_9FUNG|nr:meiosis-specific transcription factor ndt80 [Mucor velutinosus]
MAKKYVTLHEINDGHAPDNNTALFESKKRKQEVIIIGDEENGKRKKAKKLETRGAVLNAAIKEHLDENVEVEQKCPNIDDIADDDISYKRFPLESLTDNDSKNDQANNEYHKTEDLESGIKDMFKGRDSIISAGVSVEDVVVNSADDNFELSLALFLFLFFLLANSENQA